MTEQTIYYFPFAIFRSPLGTTETAKSPKAAKHAKTADIGTKGQLFCPATLI